MPLFTYDLGFSKSYPCLMITLKSGDQSSKSTSALAGCILDDRILENPKRL